MISENLGLIYTLAMFILADLITGIAKAVKRKKVKSGIIYHGLMKKAGELLIVTLAGVIEVEIGVPMFTLVILFYIGCEGISIVENMGVIGVPMPDILTSYFEDLHSKGGEVNENK